MGSGPPFPCPLCRELVEADFFVEDFRGVEFGICFICLGGIIETWSKEPMQLGIRIDRAISAWKKDDENQP